MNLKERHEKRKTLFHLNLELQGLPHPIKNGKGKTKCFHVVIMDICSYSVVLSMDKSVFNLYILSFYRGYPPWAITFALHPCSANSFCWCRRQRSGGTKRQIKVSWRKCGSRSCCYHELKPPRTFPKLFRIEGLWLEV